MLKKQRYFVIILIFFLLFPTLTGCWDRRELDERISVTGIGIDRPQDAEEGQRLYQLTVQIPIPLRIAGAGGGAGGGGGAESVKVISSTGHTVAEAFSNLQKSLNQQLFLGQTRVIAISKEMAQEGIKEIIDSFRRDPSVRRLLWFLVVEGQASELLHSDPKLETIPIAYVISLIQNGAKMGEIPDITLGKFYIATSSSGQQPILNYVRSSKEDISWIGVALFNKDKMIAHLDADESWTLMQLRGEKRGGNFLIPIEDGQANKNKMMIRPKKLKTNTSIKIKEGKVHAHYNVYIQANIIEKDFELDLSKSANLEKISKITEEVLTEKAKKLIGELQHKHKLDALELGSKVKAYHFNEWENMDWKETFPKAEITVSYKVKFRRIGMELR